MGYYEPANAVLAGLLAYGRDQEVRPKPRWLGVREALSVGFDIGSKEIFN